MSEFLKWDCETPECNPQYGLIDAYLVLDRAGEGVMFECRCDVDENWHVTPASESIEYARRAAFDLALAKTEILELCQKHDLWECPNCGQDIFPIREEDDDRS